MAGEEKEEKKEQAPADKKKLPMKLIIIIVVAVVLVLGGAAAGYFMFAGHKGKTSGQEVSGKETKKEQVKEEGSKKGGGEGGGVSGNMKQLDPFIVNLADAEGQRYLKAVIQLELENASLEGEVQGKLPQIRDEILMILSNKTFDDVSTTAGKRMVKREIASAVNKYLTGGQVTQVYFTEFVVQ
jgi:flagellar FliL protein